MEEADRAKVEDIMSGMRCPKDFQCAESGFERLCKVKDLGFERFLQCLADDADQCSFHISFGGRHFCQCPLRVYLSKKLRK